MDLRTVESRRDRAVFLFVVDNMKSSLKSAGLLDSLSHRALGRSPLSAGPPERREWRTVQRRLTPDAQHPGEKRRRSAEWRKMPLDQNFYVEQIVQGANAVTAFAAVQGVAFTISVLTAKDLANILARAPWPRAYLPVVGGIVFYAALVLLCWAKELEYLTPPPDLRCIALWLMVGRLVVILSASIPIVLAISAVRRSGKASEEAGACGTPLASRMALKPPYWPAVCAPST